MEIAAGKFLFVGNHPCLDFINTEMIVNGKPTDVLESFDEFVSWLVQVNLLTKAQADVAGAELNHKESTSLLEQVKRFRATLRELAARIVARKPIPTSIITVINQFLSQRPGYPQLVRRKSGFEQRFHSAAASVQNLLAPLAEAASDLLCRADFALIKKCGNPACILYFYDTTKNHTRNWCSMQMCGNRIKVAAHYQRKRSQSEA
ncbi:MAG: CGNR zinc finger domain-containing protein [Nitrospiraceae bacterium]